MTAADNKTIRRAIIIGALGYFVDIFDIQLFAVLRVPSLTEMGVTPEHMSAISGNILNAQMVGMILGAFLWGWLGDKMGRLKALYGSILIYSAGTLACAFVHDPVTYGLMRFVTGFGLAGETGAAITLVSELMAPGKRGWGVTIVGAIAFLGPVAAVITSWFVPWRMTYIIASILGFALFILRLKLMEPAMFRKIDASEHNRGSLKLLCNSKQGFTYLCCLLVGLPLIFSWQLLNFYAPEFSKEILLDGETFNQKICLLCFYIGTACGDILGGAVSQLWQSRRKPLFAMYGIGFCTILFYLAAAPVIKVPTNIFYAIYFVLGIMAGGWILFATIAAEHFGTNIRATTAITLTNVVRGVTIPTILAFQYLKGFMPGASAALALAVISYVAGIWALSRLRETHALDLDYVERLEKPTLKI